MAKILVAPVVDGLKAFEVKGTLTSKNFPDDGLIYYINGCSYPASIVTVIENGELDAMQEIDELHDAIIFGLNKHEARHGFVRLDDLHDMVTKLHHCAESAIKSTLKEESK